MECPDLFPLLYARILSGLRLCRPFVDCHDLCELIHASALLFWEILAPLRHSPSPNLNYLS